MWRNPCAYTLWLWSSLLCLESFYKSLQTRDRIKLCERVKWKNELRNYSWNRGDWEHLRMHINIPEFLEVNKVTEWAIYMYQPVALCIMDNTKVIRNMANVMTTMQFHNKKGHWSWTLQETEQRTTTRLWANINNCTHLLAPSLFSFHLR